MAALCAAQTFTRPLYDERPHRLEPRLAPPVLDEEGLDPRRWAGLVVVLFASFMGAMDNFIVNVSAPTIEHSLHASFGQIQLIIASYSLTYGVGLVTGGRLGDLYGRKRMFQIGTAGFTVASLASALAPSPSALIGFRLVQGLAAAVMLPQVMSIIQVTFPPHERGRAFGIFGAANGSAATAGQLIGGLLIKANVFGLGWRAIFMVNIPIGILSLTMAALMLSETKRGSEIGAGTRLDLVGVTLLGPAVFFIINPLARASSSGWGIASDLQLVAAAILLSAFVIYERRLEAKGRSPLIPLRLLHHPGFANGLMIRVLFGLSTAATFLAIAFYLQSGMGLSALGSGLMFMPLGGGFILANLLVKRLLTRVWGRVIVVGGIVQATGLLASIAVVTMGGGRHLVLLVLAFLLMGFGQGSIGNPINPISMLGLEAKETGAASGVLMTVMMVASAAGVAVLGTVYIGVVKSFGQAHFSALDRLHHYGHAYATTSAFVVAFAIGITVLASFLPRSLGVAQKLVASPKASFSVPVLEKAAALD